MMKNSNQQQFLLATLPPSRGQIRLALGIAAALLVVFLIAAPFATIQLQRVDGFVPAYQSVYAVNDLITSALILAQFAIVRRWALFALGMGFLYTALIAVAHALVFPGAFAPTGLFGAGVQTTAWLYNFWKVGLPLAVIAYSLLKDDVNGTDASQRSPKLIIFSGVAVVIVIVCGLAWIAIAGERFLPSLLSRDAVQYDRSAVRLAALFQEAWCIGALLLLWFRRNCVLDLWLMVLSFTLVLDVTMSSLLAAARFDVGWYASRIFALTASIVVLIVLLSETTALYANLARSVLRQRGVRAARQTAMDALAASIAHEISQPLGAMVLNADAGRRCLARTPPDVDEALSALRDVANDGRRASEVISGLRKMFRKGAHGRVSFDANDLFREMLAILEIELRTHQVSISTNFKEGIPPLYGDRGQLQQVLLNLVTNAIEAMGTSPDRDRVLCLTSDAMQDPSSVVLTVEDSGMGIASEDVDNIFEPFFTTKTDGIGIGLAICRSIVEAHEGTLKAIAKKPHGTIFQVVLPAAAPG